MYILTYILVLDCSVMWWRGHGSIGADTMYKYNALLGIEAYNYRANCWQYVQYGIGKLLTRMILVFLL